jgi:integrase
MPRLVALLERQRQERWMVERERGVQFENVFHRSGKPIADLADAWRAGCGVAGLEGRRFHDLRRYAATRLVRAGVARSEAMALLGHETREHVHALRHQRPADAGAAVAKVAALDASR